MEMRLLPTDLPGVVIIETEYVRDERGFFIESYHRQRFADHGLDYDFVQDNHSQSQSKVLRGIHYQGMDAPMSKLVRCTSGRILDVVVDLRVGSPHFSKWIGIELSAENMKQLIVPAGFGHAFLVLSDRADVQYKCTAYYTPAAEGTIAYDDPDIGVAWPISDPVISGRDRLGMSLKQYLANPAFTI